MSKLYIRSTDASDPKVISEVSFYKSKLEIDQRGFNIIYINDNLQICEYYNFDTYAHNYTVYIINNIISSSYNKHIKFIIILSYDECTYSINKQQLVSILSSATNINLNKFSNLNINDKYYCLYDVTLKKIISEDSSPNMLEYEYEYNLQNFENFESSQSLQSSQSSQSLQSSQDSIIIVCQTNIYYYFCEYITSLLEVKNYHLILLHNLNNFDYKLPYTYYVCWSSHYEFLMKIPENVHIINLEQMTIPRLHSMIKDYLHHKNNLLIDYSLENIAILDNPKVKFIPYIISDIETSKLIRYGSQTKIYDIGFCGGLSQRRLSIIKSLENKGYICKIIEGWYDTRDFQLGCCKIILNIHYSDTHNVYESLRCDRWAMANTLVVSETSINNTILDINDLIIFADYNNLVDKICDILTHYHDYYQNYINKRNTLYNFIFESRRGIKV